MEHDREAITKLRANSKPRILFIHSRYLQRGGEDSVVGAELKLLASRGHTVELYSRSSEELARMNRLQAGSDALWSARTSRDVAEVMARFQPDVVHVHNTFPLISPSVYWAVAKARVPVVQTLHNFRLMCPQAMLLRDGRVCESCVGRVPWRAVVHGCYRHSKPQSAVVAGMLMLHRGLGTWNNKVTRYVALNEFSRRKFISGGLPARLIAVKPNFVDMPNAPAPNPARSGFLVVGRLTEEKGIAVLADVARRLPHISFRVAGEGPMAGLLADLPNVQMLGQLAVDEVYAEMRRARALIMPSIWPETFGMVIIEAFACGLPVIASSLGAINEIVKHRVTGHLVPPGSAEALSDVVVDWSRDSSLPSRMGQAGRAVFERLYSADAAYDNAMSIYSSLAAMEAAGVRTG